MRQILVTGGAGYIGSHMVKMLAQNGFTPVTFDSLERGFKDSVVAGDFIQGDLKNPADIEKIFVAHPKIDAVFHFAAYASVPESVKEPQKYFDNNTGGTLNLLAALKKHSVKKIIFSSTCATYGEPEKIPITERERQKPVNPYGESKLRSERNIIKAAQDWELQYVLFRYFNAAGCDPEGEIGERHEPETHLIPLTIKAALDPNFILTVFGKDYPTNDGTCVRDYIHVMDLCQAHLLGLKYLESGRASSPFNLGNGQGFSNLEIVKTVSAVTGQPVKHRFGERRPGDPPTLIGDAAAAKQALGWQPKYADLPTIVETAVNFYRKLHHLS